MKRFALLFLLPVIAFAGVRQAYYYVDATNAAPYSAAQGVPVTGPNGELATSGLVTVTDFAGTLPDGGISADDVIQTADLRAWYYSPDQKKNNGDPAWIRYPALDMILDGGSLTKGVGSPLPSSALHLPSGRLYYQTSGADAGANINLILRY